MRRFFNPGIWLIAFALASGVDGIMAQAAPGPRQSFRDPASLEMKKAISDLDIDRVRQLGAQASTNDCLELDEQGRTALHYAVHQCTDESADPRPFEIVRFLAGRGACVNTPDRIGREPIFELEPLNWTSRSKMDALEILISLGADVNASAENGMTVLHHLLSVWNGASPFWPQVIDVLKKGRLNPNLANVSGETALHAFFGPKGFCTSRDSVRTERVGIAQKVFLELIELGADVKVMDKNGTTPLGEMIAESEPFYGTRETILAFADLSLASPLDINSARIKNRPAILVLCDQPQSDSLLLGRLLDLHADAKLIEADGFTGLHGAAWFYNYQNCELLLRHGADPLAQNREGRSPLHQLARSTYLTSPYFETDRGADLLKTADLLLSHGADRRLKDVTGKTAFDLLKEQRSLDPDKLIALRTLRKKLKP